MSCHFATLPNAVTQNADEFWCDMTKWHVELSAKYSNSNSHTSVQAKCSRFLKSTSARQKSNMWIISWERTLQQTSRICELFLQTTICQQHNTITNSQLHWSSMAWLQMSHFTLFHTSLTIPFHYSFLWRDAWSCLATWPGRTSHKIIPVLYKPAYRPLQGTRGGVQVVQDIPA